MVVPGGAKRTRGPDRKSRSAPDEAGVHAERKKLLRTEDTTTGKTTKRSQEQWCNNQYIKYLRTFAAP